MILLCSTLKLRVTVSSPLHFSWEFLESAVAFSKSKLLLIFFFNFFVLVTMRSRLQKQNKDATLVTYCPWAYCFILCYFLH